jgi:hypothetical protein
MNNEAFYADKIVELTRLIEAEQVEKFTMRRYATDTPQKAAHIRRNMDEADRRIADLRAQRWVAAVRQGAVAELDADGRIPLQEALRRSEAARMKDVDRKGWATS